MAKTTSTLLLGKRGLVAGVTNARSLGWAVARAWLAHGAEDVGSVATFLASDLAAHVSGQTIFVDSGISSQAFGAADRAD
ncbi:3-oxoacyl-acyl-carrier protein reductase [Hondaea fermentalgiana]|uniref:3-oxoacyl-acyl-carrier protein reductase n=1 Tax=Hondaea fermentalgiana TaxID=2315210 RepID=A0A2R5G373_9STRA|nr:3-oxoacyl-acyl-carrier protein reductase [Hondaea fermentalgiana]|eukprot:GBG24188.1 3-oxoacyl-acyl-carrier protein reductase [Hondaea fermentalgiana]